MKLNQLNIKDVVLNTAVAEFERRLRAKHPGMGPNECKHTAKRLGTQVAEVIEKNYTIQFKRQDNFTIAMLHLTTDCTGSIFVGVSKRHPDDEQNPVHAHASALNRAVIDYVKFAAD